MVKMVMSGNSWIIDLAPRRKVKGVTYWVGLIIFVCVSSVLIIFSRSLKMRVDLLNISKMLETQYSEFADSILSLSVDVNIQKTKAENTCNGWCSNPLGMLT